MPELEVVRNKRRVHCHKCFRILLAGEGIQHLMPWFHGNNPTYYLCEECHNKEEAERKPSDVDLTVYKDKVTGGFPTGQKMR